MTSINHIDICMIKDRPKRISNYGSGILVPSEPFTISWDIIPEIVRISLMPMSGIQPITGERFKAAGARILQELPSDGERNYFQARNTRFQMVQVVASLAWCDFQDGKVEAIPYAITILPASKRGSVQTCSIETVSSLIGHVNDDQQAYTGFDPFKGDWGLYSPGSFALSGLNGVSYMDEFGIVIDTFFLATDYEPSDILEFDEFIPQNSRAAYRRNRLRRMFTPFTNLSPRRIWGLETPIELFLYQELIFRGIRPRCQYLIYPDGSMYPSLYDVYSDIEFRRGQNILAEVDMFLPDQRVAIFCDGAHHERKKQRDVDQRIDAKLKNLGIRAVRVPGRLINSDLEAAGDLVVAVL